MIEKNTEDLMDTEERKDAVSEQKKKEAEKLWKNIRKWATKIE